MVGVPKSKGCLECRRQKKSCEAEADAAACVRCTRLKIPCVGRGEQRFKFQDETLRFDTASSVGRSASSELPVRKAKPKSQQLASNSRPHSAPVSRGSPSKAQAKDTPPTSAAYVPSALVHVPTNGATRLLASFLYNVDPSVDSRWTPPWSFNGLLEELPRRLGHNAALDASVEAGLAAYSDYRHRRANPEAITDERSSRRILQHYSRALHALRSCLNDSSTAGSSETLCSTLMLLMFETLGEPIEDKALGHAGGAAHILKARGHLRAKNPFESTVLLCLRGPVIFSALFNETQLFADAEWETFVPQQPSGPHENIMNVLSKVPNLLLEVRKALSGTAINYAILADVRRKIVSIREQHTATCKEVCQRFEQFERDFPNIERHVTHVRLMHSTYGRHEVVAYMTDMHLLFLLSAIDFPGKPPILLAQDRTEPLDPWMKIAAVRAEQISELAERMTYHRPLGTFYIDYMLRGAYMAAGDRNIQLRLLGQIHEYHYEMYGAKPLDLSKLELVHAWLTVGDLRLIIAQRERAAMQENDEMSVTRVADAAPSGYDWYSWALQSSGEARITDI